MPWVGTTSRCTTSCMYLGAMVHRKRIARPPPCGGSEACFPDRAPRVDACHSGVALAGRLPSSDMGRRR